MDANLSSISWALIRLIKIRFITSSKIKVVIRAKWHLSGHMKIIIEVENQNSQSSKYNGVGNNMDRRRFLSFERGNRD